MKATQLVSELMGYDDREDDHVEEVEEESEGEVIELRVGGYGEPVVKTDIKFCNGTLSDTHRNGTIGATMECTICMDEKEMFVLQCGHMFCKDCVVAHINIQVQDRNILKDKYIIEKYDNVVDLKFVSVFAVDCPHRHCKSLIERVDEILTSKKDLSIYGEACLDFLIIKMRMNGDFTRCPLGCGSFVQADCLCINPECRKLQLQLRRYEAKVEELNRLHNLHLASIRSSAAKKCCPKCYVEIAKNGGCDHMYCIMCKTHFNWSQAPEYGESLQWFRQQAKTLFHERILDPNASTSINPKIFTQSPWKQRKFFMKTNREAAEANPVIKRKFLGSLHDQQ